MAEVRISSSHGTAPWSVRLNGVEISQHVRAMSVDFGDRNDITSVTFEIYANDGFDLFLGDASVEVLPVQIEHVPGSEVS